ncbi:MAG: malto-oligosyltrehalose trehalohydrolase [Isosphaeraceae bacterium]
MPTEGSGVAQDQGAKPGRRMPIGAEIVPEGGVHFRLWAPKHRVVEVFFPGDRTNGPESALVLASEGNGYFSGMAAHVGAGARYLFRLGEGKLTRPDPASRFQPEGPLGPSEVIDPATYRWSDEGWRGPESIEGQVFYELHFGTFTPEGTFQAATAQLPYLAALGVTVLELMPINEFPGAFGWSYDGVDLFAPSHVYGTPDDFRQFIDRAHGLGLSVLLDVVYNHLGPEGNVLTDFADDYFSKRHVSEWGPTLNFDDFNAGPVREFVLTNAGYWVDEYHIDGLRIDATQGLFDESSEHIVPRLARRVRESARGRGVLVVGENEQQRARLLRPESRGGCGYDMLWSDDFHHAASVAATGSREGYYGDYLGTPQELVSVMKRGWLYQGQWNPRQSKRRGAPAFDLLPAAFLFYLQNHDQIANTAWGARFHELTTPGRFRAITALLLLAPATPLLFQGQEYAASTPFLYFGDLGPKIADEMRRGRQLFLQQFPSLATEEMQARVPHPSDPLSFRRSKLDPSERDRAPHTEALALHRDLLRLRRHDPVFRAQSPGLLDGAVLGPEAFVLRWFAPGGDGRLLVVNLGAELRLKTAAEPLLAPPAEGKRWRVLWSSEDPRYGGSGTPAPESEAHNWRLKGQTAVALAPEDAPEDEYRNFPGTI